MRKRNKRGRLFVGATLALIVVTLPPLVGLTFGDTFAPRPVSYSFVSLDIPTPSGALGSTSLSDMNRDGEITGGFANSSIGPYGFALANTYRLTEIRCAPDVLGTEPQAINNDGEITGFGSLILKRIPLPGSPFETLVTKLIGFFRNQKGRCTILDVPGATLTEAVGVNDHGQVVGDYRDAAGKFHGFVWEAGLFQTLDVPFPDTRLTAPTGINNVGQIVGFYFDNNVTSAFPNGHAHGFLSDKGIFTSLDVPDATATLPVDINDHGQIVGVSSEANNDFPHAFLLDKGRFTSITVSFPNVLFTDPSGINNRGQIVGRYAESNPRSDPANPVLSHGFIATPKKVGERTSEPVASQAKDVVPSGLSKADLHWRSKWSRLLNAREQDVDR